MVETPAERIALRYILFIINLFRLCLVDEWLQVYFIVFCNIIISPPSMNRKLHVERLHLIPHCSCKSKLATLSAAP